MNLPLYDLVEIGSGSASLERLRSANDSLTSFRMPSNAFSGDVSSQLRLGSSAQRPTYSESSSDHVTRYVYLSTSLAIVVLNSIHSEKDLSYLVGFSLAARVLDIHSRVSGPGHSINPVTSPGLSRLPKKVITDFAELSEANPFWGPPHFVDNVIDRSHR